MKTTLNTMVVLLILSFSFNSFARGGKSGMGKILKQLDLSEEQKASLKEFRKGSKDDRKAIRGALKAARENMKNAMASGESESKLRSLHEQLKTSRNKMADFRFNKLMKIRSILTPEQRSKFHELKKQLRQSRRGNKF